MLTKMGSHEVSGKLIRMKHPGYALEIEAEPYIGLPSMTLPFRAIQENSPLLNLPTEIKEIILKHLDGLSLARLTVTCSSLYNLIHEVAQWERFLLQQDLKAYHLNDLGLNFCTPLWRIPLPVPCERLHALCSLNYPWKQMYFSTLMWHSARELNFKLAWVSQVEMDQVTSVKIAGQDVLFGTVKGGLGLWNPDKFETILQPMYRFPAEVDEILVQLSSDCGNGNVNYRIVVHCVDTNMIVYDMGEYAVSGGRLMLRNFRKISSHGDKLFEWDPETGTFGCTIIKSYSMIRCSTSPTSWIGELPRGLNDGLRNGLPDGPFVAIDIFESLFISRDRGPLLLEYDCQTSRYKVDYLVKGERRLCISRGYIWPQQVSLSITVGGSVVISVGRQCSFIHWPPAIKCISALLYANVLIVGTSHGKILFYHFKDLLDLLKLNPHNYHQILDIEVLEPVIYIGIRVQNFFHNFPDVIAATRSKLFCFRVGA